jgi:outer membrane lipoprotein carrier protein
MNAVIQKSARLSALLLSAFVLVQSGDSRADGPPNMSAPPAAAAGAAAHPLVPLSAADTTALVTKVQAFYDKTTSYHCDFTQEFWVKAYNQKKSSRGKVVFAKPGKMHWSYDDPKDNKVISDGAMLRVYEAANKQLYEQGIDKSQYPAALSFLTGNGKLADHFNFELFEGNQMNFPGGFVLVGAPKQATAAYQKVLFYVDKDTSQVRRVMVLDAQGNRNRFDFTNPRVNEPVLANHFQFVPPPGTSIVRP